jgi:hypothetical protein
MIEGTNKRSNKRIKLDLKISRNPGKEEMP